MSDGGEVLCWIDKPEHSYTAARAQSGLQEENRIDPVQLELTSDWSPPAAAAD